MIDQCEKEATVRGGWTTQRHYSVPTTDLAVHSLPEVHTTYIGVFFALSNDQLMAGACMVQYCASDCVVPTSVRAVRRANNQPTGKQILKLSCYQWWRAWYQALRVHDAFIVKYDAAKGQRYSDCPFMFVY